jgi:hypothetical protein
MLEKYWMEISFVKWTLSDDFRLAHRTVGVCGQGFVVLVLFDHVAWLFFIRFL